MKKSDSSGLTRKEETSFKIDNISYKLSDQNIFKYNFSFMFWHFNTTLENPRFSTLLQIKPTSWPINDKYGGNCFTETSVDLRWTTSHYIPKDT